MEGGLILEHALRSPRLVERHLTGDENVGDDAHRPDVALLRIVRLTLQNFGGGVGLRAAERLTQLFRVGDFFDETEVAKFDGHTVVRQQEILEF